MARCLIACGSNLGSRREQLDRGLELLRFMPGVSLVAVSRPRETLPVGGPPGQPPFLNSACLIETDAGPEDVLGMLLAIENTLQRERRERWGPRTVDLDLLLYDSLVIDTPALTLPHPRMATRRFVLEPCVEIAPTARHPLADCTLSDLLDDISQPHPHVAVVGVPGVGAEAVAEAVADATLARLVRAPATLQECMCAGTPADVDWRQVLAACAAPLARDSWPAEPHLTVADYWLESLLFTFDEASARAGAVAEHARVTAGTVAPHVAILLKAGGRRLAEIAAQGSGSCGADGRAQALERLQARLVCRLRTPAGGQSPRPRAVVTIDADDPAQATLEAVAAVEAMA